MQPLLWLGLLVRAALLALGQWQDAHLHVKYTDIDYEVVTDGAALMSAGASPYGRATYRYTPLLAAALLPNVALHPAAGKLLFCAADLLAAGLMSALMRRRSAPPRLLALGQALWLFSPFTVAISTRGSGEALVTCMLLGMLLALDTGRLVPAALLYGLAVHWRLYPIVYALPLLRHYALQQRQKQHGQQQRQQQRQRQRPGGALAALAGGVLSWQGAAFGAVSGSAFLGLGALCYRAYGPAFLRETYLYHASRVDPRHNFSPYFYPAYLASSSGGDSGGGGGGSGGGGIADVGWVFSAAQLTVQAAIGWRCAGDLPFCLLLQTLALVAFNKVCTAQYFVWYLTFLPLVLPQLAVAQNRGRLLAAAAAWGCCMAHWLAWAYLLEFQGRPVHLGVWGAGLAFLAAHVWLLWELITAWRLGAGSGAQQPAAKHKLQ